MSPACGPRASFAWGRRARSWVMALDADQGKVKWKFAVQAPVVAGVTPTAGGLLLTGDLQETSTRSTSKPARSSSRRRRAEPLPAATLRYASPGSRFDLVIAVGL